MYSMSFLACRFLALGKSIQAHLRKQFSVFSDIQYSRTLHLRICKEEKYAISRDLTQVLTTLLLKQNSAIDSVLNHRQYINDYYKSTTFVEPNFLKAGHVFTKLFRFRIEIRLKVQNHWFLDNFPLSVQENLSCVYFDAVNVVLQAAQTLGLFPGDNHLMAINAVHML